MDKEYCDICDATSGFGEIDSMITRESAWSVHMACPACGSAFDETERADKKYMNLVERRWNELKNPPKPRLTLKQQFERLEAMLVDYNDSLN